MYSNTNKRWGKKNVSEDFYLKHPKKRDWAKFAGKTYIQATWCVWCFRWLGDLKNGKTSGPKTFPTVFCCPKTLKISPPVDLDSCRDAIFAATPWTPLAAFLVSQWDSGTQSCRCKNSANVSSGGFLRDLLDMVILKWLPDLKLPLSSHPISIILPSSHLAKWQECLPQNLSNLDNFD